MTSIVVVVVMAVVTALIPTIVATAVIAAAVVAAVRPDHAPTQKRGRGDERQNRSHDSYIRSVADLRQAYRRAHASAVSNRFMTGEA